MSTKRSTHVPAPAPATASKAKHLTTPEAASRAQGKTAVQNGGVPAPWVRNLQAAADRNFGRSGARKKVG